MWTALRTSASPCMIDSGLSGGKPTESKNTDKVDQKHLPLPSIIITSWFGTFEAINSSSAFLASSKRICSRSDNLFTASPLLLAPPPGLPSGRPVGYFGQGGDSRWRAYHPSPSSRHAFDQSHVFSTRNSRPMTRSFSVKTA